MRNTAINPALFFLGSLTLNNIGIGKMIMIISVEMLKTAFVIRWFVAAEHCTGTNVSKVGCEQMWRYAYCYWLEPPNIARRVYKSKLSSYVSGV
jgi:hypothetical protein